MGSLRHTWGIWFLVAMMAAAVAISPAVLMRAVMSSYIFSDAEALPQAEAALVPGASVIRGRPSPILAERTKAAEMLYKSGKVAVVLVTGAVEDRYDEVTPMKRFLTEEGVPEEDIAIDPAGVDTFTSMYRAKNVFSAKSLIIVTQDFHLPRAVFLARALGIRAYGLSVSHAGTAFDYIREIPASWKALFDILFHRKADQSVQLTPVSVA